MEASIWELEDFGKESDAAVIPDTQKEEVEKKEGKTENKGGEKKRRKEPKEKEREPEEGL